MTIFSFPKLHCYINICLLLRQIIFPISTWNSWNLPQFINACFWPVKSQHCSIFLPSNPISRHSVDWLHLWFSRVIKLRGASQLKLAMKWATRVLHRMPGACVLLEGDDTWAVRVAYRQPHRTSTDKNWFHIWDHFWEMSICCRIAWHVMQNCCWMNMTCVTQNWFSVMNSCYMLRSL